MSESEFKQYQRMYRQAKKPEDLPWHREELPESVRKALDQGVKPKRILDLGCGTGTFSVTMTKMGHHVTGVDFMPEALSMAEERAKAAGVQIKFEQADVLQWNSAEHFDLIFDSGCFHSLAPRERPRFKSKVLSWLVPGADYVLIHFGRRHFLDWRPMGPRRRTRAEIVQELTPELVECEYRQEVIHGIPLPIGPTILIGEYWFQNKGPDFDTFILQIANELGEQGEKGWKQRIENSLFGTTGTEIWVNLGCNLTKCLKECPRISPGLKEKIKGVIKKANKALAC